MLAMNDWTTLRVLKTKGHSIKNIVRELHLARNTVRKYLRSDSPPKYTRSSKINPQLAPFLEEIKIMLAKDYIGTRIFEELKKKGCQCSRPTFYRQLEKLKSETLPNKAVERFETEPGQQGQYDWSDYTVQIGDKLTKVHISSLILGFSRDQHYFASLDITQATIFQALEDSFHHFGGVPKQILFDNPKALVIKPKPDLVWNPKFLEFAGYYRFEPIACLPGRAQTKGKVEKPFAYLEEHFIKGGLFKDFSDFILQLAHFEAARRVRIHGTTQERPADRFEQEKSQLTPLPAGRFVSTHELFRKVSWDALISYDGSRYSVPWQYAGKSVWVRPSRGLAIEIYSQKGELIAQHNLSEKKGTINIKKEHYEGLRKRTPYTRTLVIQVFQEIFPEWTLFLEKLLAQYKFNATAQLRQILDLARTYPKEKMVEAFKLALEYNTFSYNFLRGILTQADAYCEEPLPKTTSLLPPSISISRDLNHYQVLIEGGVEC
jgi:transposase